MANADSPHHFQQQSPEPLQPAAEMQIVDGQVLMEPCSLDSSGEFVVECLQSSDSRTSAAIHRQEQRIFRIQPKSKQLEFAGHVQGGHLRKRGPVQTLFTELADTLKARKQTLNDVVAQATDGSGLVLTR